MFHLVCVLPCHGYEKGQKVTDPNDVARIMSSHLENHFVRVPAPPAPPPAEEEASA